MQQAGPYASHPLHVRLEVAGRADDGGIVGGVHEHVHRGAALDQGEVGAGRGGGCGGAGGEEGRGEQGSGADGRHAP